MDLWALNHRVGGSKKLFPAIWPIRSKDFRTFSHESGGGHFLLGKYLLRGMSEVVEKKVVRCFYNFLV